MEGFEMQASEKSAGQPGAPRGSVVELAHRASVETMTEAASQVFGEIARLMESQRELLSEAMQSESYGTLIQAARLQSAVCGLMADEACSAMGAARCRRDAQEWLLSPVAREALGTLKGLRQ